MNESGYASFKKAYTFDEELISELLHYGAYQADFEVENEFGTHRISVIKHDKTGRSYWLRQWNGEVVEFREVN